LDELEEDGKSKNYGGSWIQGFDYV